MIITDYKQNNLLALFRLTSQGYTVNSIQVNENPCEWLRDPSIHQHMLACPVLVLLELGPWQQV